MSNVQRTIKRVFSRIDPSYLLLATCFIILAASYLLLTPQSAQAVAVGVCPDGSDNCANVDFQWLCPKGAPDTCQSYIVWIYKYAIKLGATLAVLMILYAGYIYLFSQGDSSKLTQAKDILLGAILGFVLLLAVGLILDFLGLPSV